MRGRRHEVNAFLTSVRVTVGWVGLDVSRAGSSMGGILFGFLHFLFLVLFLEVVP